MRCLFQKTVPIAVSLGLLFLSNALAVDMTQFLIQYKKADTVKAKVEMIENLKQTLIEEIKKTKASENNLTELLRLVSYRNYLTELEINPFNKEKCADVRSHIVAIATGVSDTKSSMPYAAKDVLEIWDGLCALSEKK